MDSTSPELPGPSILVVEDDVKRRTLIVPALEQAGHEAVLASSGEDTLDLIAAADFNGLYCTIELPGQVDGWEVGTTFSLIWPAKLAVYASAVMTQPPGRLGNGIFLYKPFAMDRLVRVFEAAATAACARGQPAWPRQDRTILTSARMKVPIRSVYLP